MKSFEEKYSTKRYKTAYSATVFSITLVLFMFGLVLLLVFHTSKLTTYFRENIGVSVVIDNNADAQEVLALKSLLESQNFVKSTKYISKQQAADELRSELGEDFVEFIGYNPLPPTLEIFLFEDYTYGEKLATVETFLRQQEIVKSVEFQHSLIRLIEQNISRISKWVGIFSFLLLLISVLLIHNTIRLAIYSKRMLIKSMLLVGATQAFIRKPFIIHGIYQGLWSGAFAVCLLTVILIFTNQKLPDLALFNNWLLILAVGFSIIAFGVLITWTSNLIAIKKYLKLNSEDLY